MKNKASVKVREFFFCGYLLCVVEAIEAVRRHLKGSYLRKTDITFVKITKKRNNKKSKEKKICQPVPVVDTTWTVYFWTVIFEIL